MSSAHPVVAVVGRPNVGKSTLFNRLVGERLAIVEDMPGTTRDRLYAIGEWCGKSFLLVDTGGLEEAVENEVGGAVQRQAEEAMSQADVIVLVVDAQTGVAAPDLVVADRLRSVQARVVVAANKAENERLRLDAVQFYELGLGEVIPISAIHGQGTGDLLDAICEKLPQSGEEEEQEGVKIAIVGRPNVGKSSLTNALLGHERMIVDSTPGTTRDAVDIAFEHEGQRVVLIDTAGIRRRGRVDVGVEKHSVLRALRAIDRADVCLLLIDASEGPTAQDAHIGGFIADAGKGFAIVVNKTDLMRQAGKTIPEMSNQVRLAMPFAHYVPLVFVSAKTRARLPKIVPLALAVAQERRKRVTTAALNDMLEQAREKHNPPSKRGRQLKIYYGAQVDIEPPKFVIFVNDPELMHFTYQRYLENNIREQFGFDGVPIRVSVRARGRVRGEDEQ